MKEVKIEKLRQIVSRTDKTGNEKVDMLIEFAETYASEKVEEEKQLTREWLEDEGYELLAERV